MNTAGIYLTFNGQCREAFSYYRKCFGGELEVLQLVGDMPFGRCLSKVMKNTVVSAVLTNNYFKLVGTDLSPQGIVPGNNIGILIECSSCTERNRIGDFLSENRTNCSNTEDNLINVTDKYKVNWILSIR